jgi:hypothetical protein
MGSFLLIHSSITFRIEVASGTLTKIPSGEFCRCPPTIRLPGVALGERFGAALADFSTENFLSSERATPILWCQFC